MTRLRRKHDIARIIALWNAGLTCPEICASLSTGGHPNTINRIIRRVREKSSGVRAGITARPRKQARLMQIIDLTNAGTSPRDVGAVVGLPRASVLRILHEARTKWGYAAMLPPCRRQEHGRVDAAV